MIGRLAAGLLAVAALAGCTRGEGSAAPTISAGVPPAVRVVTVDFPSTWVVERVGGDAVDVLRVPATALSEAGTDADLVAYVPGIDAQVDAAVAGLPEEQVVDLTDDISRIADPRDDAQRDPYVWFDPVNVGIMARTLASAMSERNEVEYLATQYYGLRSLDVEAQALAVDQRLQEQFNPCRDPLLVVEAPVLGYLAKAYAFTQVPLIGWRPGRDEAEALYFTLDAEAAVQRAAARAGADAVPVDTLTEKAPDDDLLQGVVDLGDRIARHQDCPLVRPSSTDRPG